MADDKLFDDIVWTLKRSRLLFNYWTMPLLANTKPSEDIVSVRAFALVAIVALTFAVRGDPLGGTVSYTVLASAVAAAFSFGLNLLSKTTKVNVREPALVSAYASTILVMLGFLAIRPLESLDWYRRWFSDWTGNIAADICLSVAVVFVLLALKAALWDRNKLSIGAAVQGFGITIGSGAIVAIIYLISKDGFDSATKFVCTFKSCT